MTERTWNNYDAVAACEGFDGEEHDKATLLSAWQYLIHAYPVATHTNAKSH